MSFDWQRPRVSLPRLRTHPLVLAFVRGLLLVVSAMLAPVASASAFVVEIGIGAQGQSGCAVTRSGGVRCWGAQALGMQLPGVPLPFSSPADVPGLESGVAAASVGSNHACVVTTAGGVKCWGGNAYVQLGDGTTFDRPTPQFLFPSGVVAIDAGRRRTCALTSTGGVNHWGSNDRGQLGDGTTDSKFYPADVDGLSSGVLAISAGALNTCALTQNARVK